MNDEQKIPRYGHLKNEIKKKIENGEFLPGQCLPSERDFCIEYNMSRMTVRQALNDLQNEGLVYRIQGKGTFVYSRKIEQYLSKLTSFTEDMQERGFVPGGTILSIEEKAASIEIAKCLQISPGDMTIFIERLRTADGEPMAIERNYLVGKKCRKVLEADLENQSLYDFFRNDLKIKITRATQSLETVFINGNNAKYLGLPQNSLGLFMKRITFSDENKPIEYVESIYAGHKYKFYFELRGK